MIFTLSIMFLVWLCSSYDISFQVDYSKSMIFSFASLMELSVFSNFYNCVYIIYYTKSFIIYYSLDGFDYIYNKNCNIMNVNVTLL